LNGKEFMGYAPSHVLKAQDAYNQEKDIILYADDVQEQSKLMISQDYFCLFFPGEAHKPGLLVSKEAAIKKAVIKTSI
jgi:YhcH/YjgK/YiaL family protein